MTDDVEREQAVRSYDGIVSALQNEPCAYKRQCFRDGWNAAIAAMPPSEVTGWQPIETATESQPCLFFGNTRYDTGVVFCGWIAINGMLYGDADLLVCEPTHWMPLPPAPKQGGDV